MSQVLSETKIIGLPSCPVHSFALKNPALGDALYAICYFNNIFSVHELNFIQESGQYQALEVFSKKPDGDFSGFGTLAMPTKTGFNLITSAYYQIYEVNIDVVNKSIDGVTYNMNKMTTCAIPPITVNSTSFFITQDEISYSQLAPNCSLASVPINRFCGALQLDTETLVLIHKLAQRSISIVNLASNPIQVQSHPIHIIGLTPKIESAIDNMPHNKFFDTFIPIGSSGQEFLMSMGGNHAIFDYFAKTLTFLPIPQLFQQTFSIVESLDSNIVESSGSNDGTVQVVFLVDSNNYANQAIGGQAVRFNYTLNQGSLAGILAQELAVGTGDVEVIASNGSRTCHELILKASSPMLASKIQQGKLVELEAFDIEVVSALIEFVYSGRISQGKSNKKPLIESLKQVASLAQIPSLESQCDELLRKLNATGAEEEDPVKKLLQSSQYAEAVELLNKLLEKDPKNAKLHAQLSCALSSTGKIWEAFDSMLTAHESDPFSLQYETALVAYYKELSSLKALTPEQVAKLAKVKAPAFENKIKALINDSSSKPDMKFIIPEDNSVIMVHRFFLSLHKDSEMSMRILNEEADNPMIEFDCNQFAIPVSKKMVQVSLEYMYSFTVPLLQLFEFEELKQLFVCAKVFDFKQLQKELEEYLISNLSSFTISEEELYNFEYLVTMLSCDALCSAITKILHPGLDQIDKKFDLEYLLSYSPNFQVIHNDCPVTLESYTPVGPAQVEHRQVVLFNNQLPQSPSDINSAFWFRKRFTLTDNTVISYQVAVKNEFEGFQIPFFIQSEGGPYIDELQKYGNVKFPFQVLAEITNNHLSFAVNKYSLAMSNSSFAKVPLDWKTQDGLFTFKVEIAFFKVEEKHICMIVLHKVKAQQELELIHLFAYEISNEAFAHIQQATVAKPFYMGFTSKNSGLHAPFVALKKFEFNSEAGSDVIAKKFVSLLESKPMDCGNEGCPAREQNYKFMWKENNENACGYHASKMESCHGRADTAENGEYPCCNKYYYDTRVPGCVKCAHKLNSITADYW